MNSIPTGSDPKVITCSVPPPASTGDSAAPPITDAVNASLRHSPFWATDSHLWFGQVKAQFLARRIGVGPRSMATSSLHYR